MLRKPIRLSPKQKSDSALSKLVEAARRHELVVVVGTGVSVALTEGSQPSLSWFGLVQDGLGYACRKGRITKSQEATWQSLLASADIDELLSAAEFVGRKLDAPGGDLYARWLAGVFEAATPSNRKMMEAISLLTSKGIPICTLNYDTLLEAVTGLPTVNVNDTAEVFRWIRRESPGILHLHGVWQIPERCVLGIRDYETAIKDEVRDLVQRSLSSFKKLLFVGCGDTFSDPNLSALIKWSRSRLGSAAPEHAALVLESEVARRDADENWRGFIEPLSYGRRHESLPQFFDEPFWFISSSLKEKC